MSRLLSSIVGLAAIVVVGGILVVVGRPIVEQRVGHAKPPPTETPNPAPLVASPASATKVATAVATTSVAPTVIARPTAAQFTPTPTGPWITLYPDSGPPGTTVEISGFVPGRAILTPTKVSIAGGPSVIPSDAEVCWAGCPGGMLFQAIPLEWSSTENGRFTMRFTVPAIPWLDAEGVHPLSPGDYSVGVRCLPPVVKGCATVGAQAVATFHLTGPVPDLCKTGSCAHLTLSPSDASPGTLVRVTGWAPLGDVIGNQPFGYSLTLSKPGTPALDRVQLGQLEQALNGDVSGSFRVPQWVPPGQVLSPGAYRIDAQAFFANNGKAVDVASTRITVTAPPTLASLGKVRPLWIQQSSPYFGQALTSDPTDPRRLAYCSSQGIRVSTDAGATWATISTTAVASVAASTDYPTSYPGQASARCISASVDPSNTHSIYATFGAYKKSFGSMPPMFFVGYVTTDSGKTWRPIPPPTGHSPGSFGGFQVDGTAVKALYGREVFSADQSEVFAVQETTDGGHTWVSGQLNCPSSGPCIRWGPVPNGIGSCAMHGYPRPIEVSTDGGRSWTASSWPNGANACDSNELVALSRTDVLLLSGSIDGANEYPLLLSEDAGQSWRVISIPALPATVDGNQILPGLQMLPNGTLLATPSVNGVWYVLPAGATSWCPARAATLPGTPDVANSLQVIGNRLWWAIPGSETGSEPVEDFHCG